MSASDQLNGRFDTQDLTTLLYGAPIDMGFDQEVSLESMPDFNNVMPSAPDHLPDLFDIDVDVESDARA
jgi:hypothetical protein